MSALLLNSLEIKGFRAFRDLRIEKLGRVNLIVGQNNIGKTCLLEALQLYACRAQPAMLWQLLEEHQENKPIFLNSANGQNGHDPLAVLSNLFCDWPELTKPVPPIEIGPIDEPEKMLRLALEFSPSQSGEAGETAEEPQKADHVLPHFSVQLGKNQQIVYPLKQSSMKSEANVIPCIFTDAHGINKGKVSDLWNSAAFTEFHQEIVRTLQIIAPGLNDVMMIEKMDTKQERFPVITVPSLPKPLPIQTLGSGIQRMLLIMLALLNVKNGLLLIDEFEHGLHYTAQYELWVMILEMAIRLNVQVFATTHDWDSITAFQEAARDAEQEEQQSTKKDQSTMGMLFRLSLKRNDATAVLYDLQGLKVAANQDIEVR